jgi:hypothetical protein
MFPQNAQKSQKKREEEIGAFVNLVGTAIPFLIIKSQNQLQKHLRSSASSVGKNTRSSRRMRRIHREKCRRISSWRFIGWNSDSLLDYQKPEPTTKNICVICGKNSGKLSQDTQKSQRKMQKK